MSEDIESAALALPREDRARLAQRLIESLDDEGSLRAQWDDEIARRLQAYEQGDAKSRDAADVLSEIRALLRK